MRAHLRRLVRHIRQRWTRTRITFRGDGHYARPEAMEWCEANEVDYVFGLPGSKPLAKKIDEAAEAVRTERAVSNKPVVRGYAETRHKATSWSRERRHRRPHRSHPAGLDASSSSPTSNTARRNGFTTPSIVRAGRPRTSSSCTRRSSLPIEPRAVPPSATRSASFCTQRPIGSCSPFATPSPNRAISPTPSSRPCGCG